MKLLTVFLVPFAGAISSIAQTEKQLDVAAMISKVDAEAILGQPVKDPQSRNGSEGDGYYSRCNYYSELGGKSLVLRVRRDSGKVDAKKEFALVGADNGKLTPVAGLGDRAAIAHCNSTL